MEHHMYEHTVSITLYLTYAALVMGLMVCSILSPIRSVTVDNRQLRVYGVAIAYELPPAGWNTIVPTPTEAGSTTSSSSSSSSSSSNIDVEKIAGGGDLFFESNVARRSEASTSVLQRPFYDALVRELFNDLTDKSSACVDGDDAPQFAGVPLLAPSRRATTSGKTAASRNHAPSTVHRMRDETDRDATLLNSESAPAYARSTLATSSNSDSSSSDQESDGDDAPRKRMQWVYLPDLPSSAIARCMLAYLIFANLCLLFSLLLIVTLFLQLLPIHVNVPLRIAMRTFTVASPLCAILCFVMAAVLGLQGKLVRHVADGYYASSTTTAMVSRLHSGFSTTVAAAFIALVVVLLSPVIWRE